MTGTTQSQIDALKSWYAQGQPLINALAPCPTTPPPATAELANQYWGAYCGNHTYYSCGIDAQGNPQTGESFAVAATDSTPTLGHLTWGERHAVITTPTGEQWASLVAFENPSDYNQLNRLELVKAEWGEVGQTPRDITALFPGIGGCPTAPLILPAAGVWRVAMWMWVWTSHLQTGQPDARARPCYSEIRYTFGTTVTNKAWRGAGPQTRQAIPYQEIWYDESAGWVRGTSPTLPWVQTGMEIQPLQITPTFLGWDAFGKGVGCLYQYIYPDYKVALTR